MRNLHELNAYRDTSPQVKKYYGTEGNGLGGVFNIPLDKGRYLRCIASSGVGWDHVSVSLPHRCPTWEEMERVKRMFFKETETAMQLHVPPSDHISVHPYCLHIWRPTETEIPLPPSWTVA